MKLEKTAFHSSEVMKQYLLSLPGQLREGYKIGSAIKIPESYRKVRNVVFCGVGGSAIGGDILAELMNAESPVPFFVNRMSRVPAWVGKDTLAIFSSYSGNTAETLAAFQAVEKAGARMLILTSGGRLLEKAKGKRIPHLVIPGNIPPRCAIGYMTSTLLPILAALKWISFSPTQIKRICAGLERPPKLEAKKIAKMLQGKQIFLYTHERFFSPVVKRWKGQLAENAKNISSFHLFPEMLHNEIEGWQLPSGFPKKSAAVFIQDMASSPRIKRKVSATMHLIRSRGAAVIELSAPPGPLFKRLFMLVTLGDWVSYELAILNKVDPLSIPNIEKIKNNY